LKIIDISVGLDYFRKRSQVQKFTVQGYKKLRHLL